MKIALFHNLPSGGAKRAVYEQVRQLAKHHAIDLFTLSSANQEFLDVRSYCSKVIVEKYSPGRLLKSPFGRMNQLIRLLDLVRLRGKMKGLAEQIQGGDYDIAFVHQCFLTNSPTILKDLKIPTLFYSHDTLRSIYDPVIPRPYRRNHKLSSFIDRFDPLRLSYYKLLANEDRTSMRAATKIITNSYFLRESIYRISGRAPFVNYLGADTNTFRPLDLPRQKFVISVGAILPNKGYDTAIQCIARIPKQIRPILIIAGNAASVEEQNYLMMLADELEVKLEIRHNLNDTEQTTLYNQALCTLYTPILEPFGLVAIESMACGTPVVGIREGGVRESVVDGETGFLCERDPGQLSEAIVILINNHSLSEKMGRQARQHIEDHWTWEQSTLDLENHLQKTIQYT
jgi:glycosyltransferase involved in cell wall biosynthesis